MGPQEQPSASANAVVRTILDRIADGRHDVVVVGYPGSGRTRVLRDVADRIAHACVAHGSQPGLGSPFGSLRGLLAGTTRLPTDHAGWDMLLHEQLPDPVVLLCDDLPRFDPPSLAVIERLLSVRRITMVASACAHELRSTALLRDGVTQLVLAPLDDDDARQLVADRSPELAKTCPELLERIADAGGNPGLLLAMAARFENAGTCDAGTLPPHDIPQLRLLGAPPRRVLDALAVADHSMEVEQLADALDLDQVTVVTSLVELADRGIVDLDGPGARLVVPWIAQALLAATPTALRGHIHRRLARALQHSAISSVWVARHVLAGGSMTEGSLPWLLRAADETVSRSPGDTVDFLAAAVEIQRRTGSPSADVLDRLGRALIAAGRPNDAAGLARATLREPSGARSVLPLSVTLAEALWLGDRVAESVIELEHAGRSSTIGDGQRLTIEARRSIGLVLSGAFAEGEAAADAVLVEATAQDAHEAISIVSSTKAHLAYYAGDLFGARDAAQRALDAAEQSGSGDELRRARYDLGMFLIHVDEVDAAIEFFRGERVLDSGTGTAWHEPLYTIGLGIALYTVGSWSEAIERLGVGLELADATGILWESTAARAYIAAVHARRGELDAARSVIERTPVRHRDTHHHSEDALLWARALIREVEGDTEGALELLERSRQLITRFEVPVRLRWLVPDLVRVAIRVGDTDGASQGVRDLRGLVRPACPAYLAGITAHSEAILYGDPPLAERAVTLLRASRRPFELAAASETAGSLLRSHGETRRGLAHQAEALALFGQLGANVAVARVRQALDGFGIDDLRGSALVDASRLASLTPAENRVAHLAAKGLTNAEIAEHLRISPRTAEVHLTRIFAKLGLRSRVELAAKLPRWNS